MSFKIVVSPRAQREILNAIEYYAMYSNLAPRKFIDAVECSYRQLSQNPFLEIKYENIMPIQNQ